MRFSNLHTHTVFSDGKNTPRENILSAIDKNMLSLGFSDHSYTFCDESYCMMLSDYKKYRAEIMALKSEFRDTLPVFLGIEKDFYSEIDRADYDYVIASVHYIIADGETYAIDHTVDHQRRCIANSFGGNALDMAKRYFEMTVDHARAASPDVIGHFDVINKFGLFDGNEQYLKIAAEAAREISGYCKRFEINTGGIARGYRTEPYPMAGLLGVIKDAGCKVVINSDSHLSKNLDFAFELAADKAREAGFDSFDVLTDAGFVPVKL